MKLSVAMITYNHEQFIGQAIESILAQKVNFDFEIIIGEDCSTDSTRAVILDFQRRHPDRIAPILRDQNVGAMRNFAETIAACRGQYVALLEGDDYWTSADKLQRQVEFLDAHPDYAICCHRVQFLDEMATNRAGVFPRGSSGSYTLEDLLKGNFIMTCTVVYRRGSEFLPPWFRQMKLGDWPLMALVARSGKINLMDEIMAVYRLHSGGIWSSRPRASQLLECIRILEALDPELEFRYTNTIRRTIAQFHFDLAINARADARRWETAKHIANCIGKGRSQLPASWLTMTGLVGYALIGNWFEKIVSTMKRGSRG